MNINEHPQVLAALLNPKQKYTILTLGAGMFGGLSVMQTVTRGFLQDRLAYSEPRKKKCYAYDKLIEKGCILLRGHHDRKIAESSGGSFIMDGTNRVLMDENGPDDLIKFLADNCVFHTANKVRSITAVHRITERGILNGTIVKEMEILPMLLATLPPALDLSETEPTPVAAPTRHRIFTDLQLQRLIDAGPDNMIPIFKLFNPAGAATWLITSIDEDHETMWGYADLGMDCVEFGSISLEELETIKLPLGLHIERDKFFDGCDYTPSELLSMRSLPTSFRKSA